MRICIVRHLNIPGRRDDLERFLNGGGQGRGMSSSQSLNNKEERARCTFEGYVARNSTTVQIRIRQWRRMCVTTSYVLHPVLLFLFFPPSPTPFFFFYHPVVIQRCRVRPEHRTRVPPPLIYPSLPPQTACYPKGVGRGSRCSDIAVGRSNLSLSRLVLSSATHFDAVTR